MLITVYFSNNGVPATGLSPIIRIRNASTEALVITDAAMTEIGDGFYKYNFATYDEEINYTIRADGGAGLSNPDRYKFGSNVNQILEERTTFIQDVEGGGWELSGNQQIFTKEDNITEVMRMNLYDKDGNLIDPTDDAAVVVKRERV